MTGLPLPLAEPSELVARTREGYEGAFTALVATYQPRVFRWALALSGDGDAAEDITQETNGKCSSCATSKGARQPKSPCPRAHAAGCGDCDRVTRVVAERERNMLLAYGEVSSSVPAAQIAAHAVDASRRRRTAFFYKLVLGGTAVTTIVFMGMSRRLVPTPPPTISDTFQLHCMSPAQAAELLRPHMGVSGRITFRPNSPLGVLNVEGSLEEMATVVSVLDHYDNAASSTCERK